MKWTNICPMPNISWNSAFIFSRWYRKERLLNPIVTIRAADRPVHEQVGTSSGFGDLGALGFKSTAVDRLVVKFHS